MFLINYLSSEICTHNNINLYFSYIYKKHIFLVFNVMCVVIIYNT